MNRLFPQATASFSLFWRYFLLLALVVTLFLSALTFSSHQSTDTLRESYLRQTEEAFRRNSELFSASVCDISNLISSVESSQYFSAASLASLPLTPKDSYYLSELRKTFLRQCNLLDLPDNRFLYLERAQICMTGGRIYFEAQEAFSAFRSQDSYPPLYDTVLRLSQQSASLPTFLLMPVCSASDSAAPSSDHLAVLVNSVFRKQVYVFIYSEQDILNAFHLSSLPENTSFQLISSADKSILFSHAASAANNDEFVYISTPLPALSCTAVLGIPQSYFTGLIRDSQAPVHLVFLICMVLGVLMCFFFSHISVQPFRRLIQNHSQTLNSTDLPGNELIAIDHFLHNAQKNNEAVNSMLLSSLLVRAYSGQPVSESEYQALVSAFPLLQSPLRTAIVRSLDPDRTSRENNSLIRLLQNSLPEEFLFECINLQESLILFQDEPEAFDLLHVALTDLNEGSQDHPLFVCGISAPFVGPEELAHAIRQAQFSIPEDGEGIAVLFSDIPDPGSPEESTEILNQFHLALSRWDRQNVIEQLETFVRSAPMGTAARPEELYYSLLFLLRDTAHTANLPFPSQELTAYQHTHSPSDNIRSLLRLAESLFDHRSALQSDSRQQQKEQIVQYIRDNYSDTALSLYNVAQHFCVSVRFVQNVVQAVTGKNFINFLTGIRMEHAARLLQETQTPITAVAEQCGYPASSTFYRNFKKCYLITPVEYRDKFAHQAQSSSADLQQ